MSTSRKFGGSFSIAFRTRVSLSFWSTASSGLGARESGEKRFSSNSAASCSGRFAIAEVKSADTAPVHSPEPATQPYPKAQTDRLDLAGKPATRTALLPSPVWNISALALFLLIASLAVWKLHS